MNLLKIGVLALVCVLALALVACGDDDDAGDDVDVTTAPATETDAPTDAPDGETEAPDDETEAPGDQTEAPNGAQTEFDVQAIDFNFAPTAITVPAAEEVTFAVDNSGAAPHTMTIYADSGYEEPVDGGDTGTLAGGGSDSISVTFDAGMYFFRCDIHPQMQGTITAE